MLFGDKGEQEQEEKTLFAESCRGQCDRPTVSESSVQQILRLFLKENAHHASLPAEASSSSTSSSPPPSLVLAPPSANDREQVPP